ncbi:peptidyl-prolyl cis-trans isomerase [Bacillus shivajii]|uniref:peptidyl-prolyl cis-trans isomerase n=1 Tax=Bacillus shivajii TaxID=1983719 RepID=UPI001CFA1461|nr:peptidyl-prolyl cis-trans isomerase [Bacillus shivajii]UCZ51868.1 peptidyl-prolyl cis-trans isomerase [Bacillus shivajii]
MILLIKGNVQHTITIDPGVWIFDDRKVDLDTYFSQDQLNHQNQELNDLGKAWDNHRQEGTKSFSNGNDVKMSRKEIKESSYGIPLYPFLRNATPNEQASHILFKCKEGEDHKIVLEEAQEGILGFSHKGSPLVEDGPVHFYYRDGSNKDNPITSIEQIIVE